MRLAARHRAIYYVLNVCCALVLVSDGMQVRAQQASVSAWDAADFRSWSFIPYWTTQSQLNSFAPDGMYKHVSDVLYFSGVQPKPDGSLHYLGAATQHLTTLKSQAAANGFRLHISMRDPNGGSEEAVWTSITGIPANRARFVTNVTNLLVANNMKGFNLDWERPDTVAEWGNYTQLAKDIRAAINPLGMEVSVDDYGFADPLWDDSPVFDARTYDQLFIMGYHYPANNGTNLDQQSFADGKLALIGQGTAKAFKNEQLVIGIGTWGDKGPAQKGLKAIVAANPNLPPDATSFTGTVTDAGGTHTGTWDIESRYEVRDKVQLALDRNMAGVMYWTMHFDATNKLGLHQVAHHYAMFKRNVPDVNLDGRVNATDANILADNMGTVPGWKGTATAAQFDNFYLSGNWEKGDRDGNGFVNQQDADWLAGRFTALGLTLPDRLAYTGTFENFQDAHGLSGRWQAVRSTGGQLPETGNYTQHGSGFLTFAGSGPGANLHGNTAITLRNQNAAEAFDSLNTQARVMRVDLADPIDLAQDEDTYFTFLVRQNTSPLLASQLASPNRTLSLEFLDAAGQPQFDVSLFGQQEDFAIRHHADPTGEDVSADGFAANATYLFVGKIAGNGVGANTLHASLFANGATVGKFTDAGFEWMLTADGSAGFNPLITQLQLSSLYEANYTVSNVWIGGAHDFFAPTPAELGDFNGDGSVDAADYVVWRRGLGTTYSQVHYNVWRAHFGQNVASGNGLAIASQFHAVPEPGAAGLLLFGIIAAFSIAAQGAIAGLDVARHGWDSIGPFSHLKP